MKKKKKNPNLDQFCFLKKMLPLPPVEIKYSFCVTNIYNLAASAFL